MYKDALRTLERQFGQSQSDVTAHLDKVGSFQPLGMNKFDNIIIYSRTVSSLVGVFNLFSYNCELKSASLITRQSKSVSPITRQCKKMSRLVEAKGRGT